MNNSIEEDKQCELCKREWWRGKVNKVVKAGKDCKLCKREVVGNDCDCTFPGGTFTGKRWDEKSGEDILVWKGIPIKDIARISGAGCWTENGKRFDYFLINMNDNEREYKMVYEDCHKRNEERTEVYTMYNEYHNVPESYLIQNTVFAMVNGVRVKVGMKVRTNIGTDKYLMDYEIEKLRREGKIEDSGRRQMAYIQAFEILANKPTKELKPEYIKQLKHMGYKIPGVTDCKLDTDAIEWREIGASYCEFCNETNNVKTMFIRGIEIDAHLCEDCVDVELTKSIKKMLE